MKLLNKEQHEQYMSRMRSFKRMGDKKAIAKELAKWGKQVNQRFYRLEKAGMADDSYAYRRAVHELDSDHPRYPTNVKKLEKMDMADLWLYASIESYKIVSPTGSVAGIKKMYKDNIDKGWKAVNDMLKEKNLHLTKRDFKNFIESMGTDYLNAPNLDSNQIFEDMALFVSKNKSLSVEQFVREFNRFKGKETINYNALKRNLLAKETRNIERGKTLKDKKKKYKGSKNSGTRQRRSK